MPISTLTHQGDKDGNALFAELVTISSFVEGYQQTSDGTKEV